MIYSQGGDQLCRTCELTSPAAEACEPLAPMFYHRLTAMLSTLKAQFRPIEREPAWPGRPAKKVSAPSAASVVKVTLV